MKHLYKNIVIVAMFLFLNTVLFAQDVKYELVNLTELMGTKITARSISDFGYITGATVVDGVQHAFLWKNDSLKIIPELPHTSFGSSHGITCNDSGFVVGTSYGNGFLYDGINIKEMPPFIFTQSWNNSPEDINNFGVVTGVATFTDVGSVRSAAYIYKNNKMVNITEGTWAEGNSRGYAINSLDEVVGRASTGAGSHSFGFLYKNDSLFNLGNLDGAIGSTAYDINDSSWVVGKSTDKAFLWKINTGMIELENFTEVTRSAAYAINNSGVIVGENHLATIWEEGEAINLNNLVDAPEVVLRKAVDINNLGQIIVQGQSGNSIHYYLLTPKVETKGIVVNTNGDGSDADINDGVCDTDLSKSGEQCSFRAAIEHANHTSGTDSITFNIPGGGIPVISTKSPLPKISTKIIIDATTQPGSKMVELDGNIAGGSTNGLELTTNNCEVRGLIINKFGKDGIKITGNKNKIIGNIIGTNKNSVTGLGNGGNGISITNAKNNIIGELEVDKLNIITSNKTNGVLITGSGSTGNQIKANYIGTDTLGTDGLGNKNIGILIDGGANNNIIGTDTDITEPQNNTKGLSKTSGLGTISNVIVNSINLIKVKNSNFNSIKGSLAGLFKRPLGKKIRRINFFKNLNKIGILFKNSKKNTVFKSIIGGTVGDGIRITGGLSNFNKVFKSLIGTGPSGAEGLGCGGNGICIDSGAVNNQLGGIGKDSTLTIVASKKYGVQVQDVTKPSSNAFTNIINSTMGIFKQKQTVTNDSPQSTNLSIKLPNLLGGICVLNSANTIIGKPEAPNTIAGNGGVGILLKGFFTQFSKINSNFIGTTKDGEEGIGNEGDGISIVDSSSNNTIGGLLKELSNVIGGNKNHGIAILGGGSNNILANLIGMVKKTDGTKKPLGNLAHGILLQNSFKNLLNKCQIGGNKKNGVGISGISSKLNKIFGVIIGSDSSGTTGLGNGLNGISIFNMASNNSVGGFGKDSSVTIVASKKYGVFTSDLLSGFKNAIKNASIGLLKSTNTQLNKNNNTTINIKMPNLLGGMCLENTQHMQIGLPSAPNMIAGNSGPGIIFKGFATKLNKVFANFFGTDSIGTEGLGNLGANIKMFNGANNNWIGNEKEENGNILVASKSHGIELTNTSKNKILNNMVGLFKRPLLPTKKMGNLIGLFINNSNSTIVKKSIFSGNRKDGMRITGSGSMFSRIIENAFGTDLKGEGIHGNGGNGICVDGGANNITIGSNKPEEKNYINSNALFGLLLKNANNISLINSNIGADKKSFLSDFYKNRKGGVHVEKSDNSSLGSAINSIVNNVGNIVSGYDSSGIKITKSFRTLVKNNKIFSSFIGVKATQSSSANIVRNIIRNCIKAISIEDDPNNLISGNIISRSTGLASSIHMYNSGGKIEGNIITDDAGDAIYLEDGSNPIVTKNNIYNNSGFGLRNESSGITINAQSNWWGDSGGPSGQGSGGGDKVSSNVNFQNWETEVSNLIVLGGQDTTYQTPGATDTLFSSVLNWSNPSDIVDISIDDLKGWITGQKSFSISLDDSLGSSFPISISIPNGTTQGELTKITINAKSQSNNSHTDETDFYVATHSPVLSKIVLSPDSANVTVGDTLQFSVIGYDQIFHQLNFMAQWNASLGTIDTSGMFIAGESSGIAKVSVSDPITKLVSEAIVVIGTPTDIKEEASELPNEFVLAQNYPNPFNPTTKIRFSLPETSDVKLKVYNIIGEQVTTLVNNSMDAGVHEVNFDASSLSSGVYIYRIVAGNFSDVKKMILLQ